MLWPMIRAPLEMRCSSITITQIVPGILLHVRGFKVWRHVTTAAVAKRLSIPDGLMALLLPNFPLHKPISFLPQGRYVGKGRFGLRRPTVSGHTAGWNLLIDKLNTPLILYYAGQSNVVDAVTRNHYREVQQPIWERLAEERLRVVEAKLKISGAYYMALSLVYLGCW